jgi:hypothetical protein
MPPGNGGFSNEDIVNNGARVSSCDDDFVI